ncbi:60S ribosomal protein L22 [Thelohanellus kitauei]|uniref:Large ribosomal subunit protein eL22 n=1 Tax=Thelohanellus kitauei TaxID=669202 RepID=A0A0C2LZX5_THEKT|nr:60S ribosomal protein L22 [Thelohanellus kitauei]
MVQGQKVLHYVLGLTKSQKKPKTVHRYIDCTRCIEDNFFTLDQLHEFMDSEFKVEGKLNNWSAGVRIKRVQNKLMIISTVPYPKRYLKYLTKKYLKKLMLRDWIRVVATSKNAYELRYYNIPDQDEEEE